MFILDKEKITEFDLDKAYDFVSFWSNCYDYKIKDIDYEKELNIGNDLTINNVKNLLHWKSPRNTGEESSIINKIDSDLIININKFRNGELEENDFREIAKGVVLKGEVLQIFLFHISRSKEYPIFDRYVAFACYMHKKCPNKEANWKNYEYYKNYFNEIYEKVKTNWGGIEEEKLKKKIDDALWIFGQFLMGYYNCFEKRETENEK